MKYFISHNEIENKFAEEFIQLLSMGAGISINNIFCSSLPGCDIKTGKDFVKYIHKELECSDVVFALFSQNYIESSFCMAELGAAWILNKEVIPIIIKGDLEFSQTTALCRNISGIKIYNEKVDDENEGISKIAELIKEHGDRINVPRWAKYRKQFIKNIERLVNEPTEPKVIDIKKYKKILRLNESYKNQIKELQQELINKDKLNEELKNAKTKNDVQKIIDNQNKDLIMEFNQKCNEIKNKLERFPKIVRFAIYRKINLEEISYREARDKYDNNIIRNALDNHYIQDTDNGYEINLDSIKIRNLMEVVNSFVNYINNVSVEVCNFIEQEYEIDADITNKSFWEECIGITF